MQEKDDIELLRRYADHNSEEAFAALVGRHLNLVYSVALRHVGNPHYAEEITQAVFVILARKSGLLSKKVVLSGWFYHAARLTAANFLRSETQRVRREQEAYMQSILNESEPDVWPQLAPLLDTAMAGLGEKDRDAVVLRFFEGKKMNEVGAALGTNEEAAKKRVNRAVEKLRHFFIKRGVVLPVAVLTAAISANSVQAAPVALVKTISAVAIAKGAAASTSTLTIVKGALKIMAWTKAKTTIVVGVSVLLVAGIGTVTIVGSQSGHGPLGFIEKKREKDALMRQMDSMISVHAVIWAFAHANQDELPKNVAQLRPYLSTEIAGFDDEHWEIVASGKITTELMKQNGILLRQKNVPPDTSKIIMYMDGSMSYKK